MVDFSRDERDKLINYIIEKHSDSICIECRYYGIHCSGRNCQAAENNFIGGLSDSEWEQYFLDMMNEKIF